MTKALDIGTVAFMGHHFSSGLLANFLGQFGIAISGTTILMICGMVVVALKSFNQSVKRPLPEGPWRKFDPETYSSEEATE